jgi:hypothetical protein
MSRAQTILMRGSSVAMHFQIALPIAPRAAALVSTSGKSKERIVADMARALRWAGLLKPGKPR